MRAIWVTRYDYTTADHVKRIIADCDDAGFNTVLFQVRGNGTAFYDSNLEPWADELGGTDPGYDPLALACAEAHARGMDLHAWVNVMPAWRGRTPPTKAEQLYNQHPEWFWYAADGQRQALTSFYVSLNPCLPEVRDYLVAVFEDLVSRYEIDGLHMDYIRFPNERPERGAADLPDFPRDARTLALYKQDTGKTPDEDIEAWNKWRTAQVSRLVADIHDMMRRAKADAALSASVGSVRENALRHFQDGRRWMDEGDLDFAILMNYTDSPEEFAQRIEPWLADRPDVPVVPGLWFGRHQGKPVEEATDAVQQQIDIAREQTGNFCIFAYASLFDSPDEELTDQSEAQKRRRQTRREILLPSLRELAEQDGA